MTVVFNHPFQLKGMEAVQAPGAYSVDVDAERIESVSQVGYRHVATYLYLPSNGGSRMVGVDDGELKAALEDDVAHGPSAESQT